MKAIPILAATLVLSAVAISAAAQSPSDFFAGRNITLLVGFGAGGEDDLWARVIAKHMGDHIPGHPTIVSQNVPGAGSLLLANRLGSVAPRDGSLLGMINRGLAFEPLLGGQGAQFDGLRLNWIGSPNRDTTVCAARKDSAVNSMQDVLARELTVGATGSGSDSNTYPALLSAILGMKFRVVRGYQSSHEIQLAMERNEVEGFCLAYDPVARGTLFETGQLNVLLQAALDPDPRLGNVPSALSSARSEEERQALELFFARAALGRPIVAPPEVPTDRILALRKAFDDTMRDPSFVAEAEARKLRVYPTGGAQLTDILAKAYATPSAIVRRTMQAMGRGS